MNMVYIWKLVTSEQLYFLPHVKMCVHMMYFLSSLPLAHAVVSPSQFSIGDTSGADYQPYQHGGIARQVKVHKTLHFVSVRKSSLSDCIVKRRESGYQYTMYMYIYWDE